MMTRRKPLTPRLPPLRWTETPRGAFLVEVIHGEMHRYSLELDSASFRYILFVNGSAVTSAPNLEEGKVQARRFRLRARK
jgi:hypothetical protein